MNILKINSLIIVLIFAFNNNCLSQENTKTKGNLSNSININKNRIKPDSLGKFIENFKPVVLPFEFTYTADSIIIDGSWINYFYKDYEDSGEKLYCNYVFYSSSYLGLIINSNWEPGVAGVSNNNIDLFTISYDGKIIDELDLGCFCFDSNMGSNDYYSTELNVAIDTNKIIRNEKHTHAILVEEEGEESFEEVKHKTYKYNVNSVGEIKIKNEE